MCVGAVLADYRCTNLCCRTCQEQDKEGMSPAALFHAGLRGDDERNIAYENLGTLKLYPGIQVASNLDDDKYN